MKRRTFRTFAVAALAMLAVGIALGGCGGGGGGGDDGGSSGAGVVIGASFVGFNTSPSPSGPNVGVPLPTVFLDEAIELRFDGPIDPTSLGGLYSQNGQPVVFIGISANPQVGVPYRAFSNQQLARSSIEIRENQTAAFLPSYIVGIHRDKPDTIVIDPKVPAGNPFGLPFNAGYTLNTEYTFRIPANNSIRLTNGTSLQAFGISPLLYPITTPNFTPSPGLSTVFLSGNATGPDPVPPQVVSITAQSGAQGTQGNPILGTDSLIVTFSKPVAPSSIDLLSNLTIRNASQSNQIVPGTFVQNPSDPRMFTFTPQPSFGPGPYNIEVRVGSFMNPGIPSILGLPQGAAATQLPLSNSLARTFVTEVCATCVGASSVTENFESTLQRDASFTPLFNALAWNDASNPQPGQLCNVAISGTPYFTSGVGVQGTRVQRTLSVSFPGTIGGISNPAGLFSPFDDNGTNNLGAGVNPGGGSHMMHLYEAADIGSPRDALELIEWHPTNDFVQQTTYPNYLAWCGQTTITAPVTCPTGVPGMTAVYSQNYNILTVQTPDPLNVASPPVSCPFPLTLPANTVGGVRVTGVGTNGVPYAAGPAFTSYYGYPLFTPPFDYIGSGAAGTATTVGSGNLLFEQNIAPGTQLANFHRYRSAAVSPVRRAFGAPKTYTSNCVTGSTVANGSGCDVYDLRFTFVKIHGSGRSNFYDTGTAAPNYTNFQLNPRPQEQPGGSSAVWELEGANAISAPSTPSGPTTGFLTYWSGTPATGTQNNLVLTNTATGTPPGITGRRYFRFRVTLRNDNVANGRQCYNSFIMAFTF